MAGHRLMAPDMHSRWNVRNPCFSVPELAGPRLMAPGAIVHVMLFVHQNWLVIVLCVECALRTGFQNSCFWVPGLAGHRLLAPRALQIVNKNDTCPLPTAPGWLPPPAPALKIVIFHLTFLIKTILFRSRPLPAGCLDRPRR